MAKITKKKKADQPVIEPEVVGEVKETEVEEFAPTADSETYVALSNPTFTVKLDTKRLEGLTEDRVVALVHGAIRSVKKIVIEAE